MIPGPNSSEMVDSNAGKKFHVRLQMERGSVGKLTSNDLTNVFEASELQRLLRKRIASHPDEIDYEYIAHITPCQYSILHRRIDLLEILVLQGRANLSAAVYTDGKENLSLFTDGVIPEAVQELLDEQEKQKSRNYAHVADILHGSYSKSGSEIVEQLKKRIEEAPHEINEKTYKGRTALHWASHYQLSKNVINLLIENNANTKVRDVDNKTPAQLNSLYSQTELIEQFRLPIEKVCIGEIVKRSNDKREDRTYTIDGIVLKLIERIKTHPQEVHVQYIQNYTPTQLAITYNEFKLIEVLVFLGKADLDFEIKNVGVYKSNDNFDKLLSLLLQEKKARDARKYENLHDLLHQAKLDPSDSTFEFIKRRLARYSNEINGKGYRGRTALHWAIIWELPDKYLELLISNGANPKLVDDQGKTPAEWCHDVIMMRAKILSIQSNKEKLNFSKKPILSEEPVNPLTNDEIADAAIGVSRISIRRSKIFSKIEGRLRRSTDQAGSPTTPTTTRKRFFSTLL